MAGIPLRRRQPGIIFYPVRDPELRVLRCKVAPQPSLAVRPVLTGGPLGIELLYIDLPTIEERFSNGSLRVAPLTRAPADQNELIALVVMVFQCSIIYPAIILLGESGILDGLREISRLRYFDALDTGLIEISLVFARMVLRLNGRVRARRSPPR
jgi:hypothetical protein